MLQYTLNGRLAADPVFTTYGLDSTEMARLRIASNNPGSTSTDFYDVAVFGDTIDAIRSAGKGDAIKLSGTGHQHVWTTDAGDRRENISLVARKVLEHHPRRAATSQQAAAATAEHTAPAVHTR